MTDGSGIARCVLRTTAVEVIPFSSVGAAHAAAEGEGDLTLEYWREGHWKYFVRELESMGITATHDMPVVCELFELAYMEKDEA